MISASRRSDLAAASVSGVPIPLASSASFTSSMFDGAGRVTLHDPVATGVEPRGHIRGGRSLHAQALQTAAAASRKKRGAPTGRGGHVDREVKGAFDVALNDRCVDASDLLVPKVLVGCRDVAGA